MGIWSSMARSGRTFVLRSISQNVRCQLGNHFYFQFQLTSGLENFQTFVSDAMFQYLVFCARVLGTVWSNWTNTPFESQYLRTFVEVRIHSPIIYNFRKLVDIGFWLLEMGMKQLQEVRNSVGVTSRSPGGWYMLTNIYDNGTFVNFVEPQCASYRPSPKFSR